MTIQHGLITNDADIHEPKGIGTAASGKVYVSDGTGTGAWQYPLPPGGDTAATGEVFISDGAGGGSWKSPAGKHFAELYIDAGTTPFTLAAASAYTRLDPGTEWTLGANLDMTTSAIDGTITLPHQGSYMINFWVNFTTTAISSSSNYSFKYGLDGVVSTRKFTVQKSTNQVEFLLTSASGIVTTTADNQVLDIRVAGDGTSSGTAITVVDAGLSAFLLSEV
jgi:hypothetical protein